MRTVWYPLHVPVAFVAYGCWTAAAAASLSWFVDRDAAWLGLIDRLSLWGFALWSLSMIFGGIWGVVSWGAYFMWDPKVIWSVILWFHYATFVHVRLTPSMQGRQWARPALALAGFLFVFVAYVGTSFFFGRSTHAF
jgi:ABC-type transport system involved in cytochrome c biogenesis permease subunit